jgi:hypothetical protein
MTGARHVADGGSAHSSEPSGNDTIRTAPTAKQPPLLTSRRARLAGAGILGTARLLRGVSSLHY